MKRFISILMVALFAATVFVGCGKSTPEGKYVLKSIGGKSVEDKIKEEAGGAGAEVTEEQIKAFLTLMGIGAPEELITLELKKDDVAEMKTAGEDAVTGTWEQKDGKLTITLDGETVEVTLKGNELSFAQDGQEFVFVKK